MKLQRAFAAFLLFAFVTPVWGQVRQPREIDSLLKAASKALDHWQERLESLCGRRIDVKSDYAQNAPPRFWLGLQNGF